MLKNHSRIPQRLLAPSLFHAILIGACYRCHCNNGSLVCEFTRYRGAIEFPVDRTLLQHLRTYLLTTGQFAGIRHLSRRTVQRWCNDQRLKCFRLPGSQTRYVMDDHLVTLAAREIGEYEVAQRKGTG